jgi:hypothetical protein
LALTSGQYIAGSQRFCLRLNGQLLTAGHMDVPVATFLRRQLRYAMKMVKASGQDTKSVEWWLARIDELERQEPTAEPELLAAESAPAYGAGKDGAAKA